jgi:hypothetical protein
VLFQETAHSSSFIGSAVEKGGELAGLCLGAISECQLQQSAFVGQHRLGEVKWFDNIGLLTRFAGLSSRMETIPLRARPNRVPR